MSKFTFIRMTTLISGLVMFWSPYTLATLTSNSYTQMIAGNDADNSSRNTRDQSAGAVTADQQSSKTNDVEITRKIRQEIIADPQLSVYAKNIKIISNHGKVVLKGPVHSMEEEAAILEKARQVAGASKVVNQLEVKK